MILVIIGIWLGFLWLLVKIGILKGWALWMKVSPVVIWALAMLLIFVPLNWNSPVGPATVTIGSVQITPNVSGKVDEVLVKSRVLIPEGELLFRIDPTRYEATLRQAEARLALAKEQFERKSILLDRGTVSEAEAQVVATELAAAEAQVAIAREDLDDTEVRAPFDGMIPAMTLLPGNRVGPNAPVLAFLAINRPVVNLILNQNHIRNVKVGQKAEAVFRIYPGRTFSGTVSGLYKTDPSAEYNLSGQSPEIPDVSDTQYVVTLDLDLGGLELPPGASGQGAVLTDAGAATHFLRQITLRMTTWLNYF